MSEISREELEQIVEQLKMEKDVRDDLKRLEQAPKVSEQPQPTPWFQDAESARMARNLKKGGFTRIE